jgi:hypothetical protein
MGTSGTIQLPLTTAQYSSNILAALTTTGISQLSPGGKARAFADIVSDTMANMESRQFNNLTLTLLPFATGTALDFFGQIYGVPRLTQQDSSVISSDNNLEFYVANGNFGSINSGNAINIPAGVQITTSTPGGPILLTNAMTLLANQSSFYFGATSLYAGAAGNAAANTLTAHNFTAYTDSLYGSLLVVNNAGVVGGTEAESDDDYRYRMNLKIMANGGANQAALTFVLLTIPGIQNVVFATLAGTFIVYVYAISPQVPASLLQLVQQTLDNTVAYPLLGQVVAPNLVGISLDTTVTFNTGVAAANQSSDLTNAAAAAANYINNLAIGQTLVINKIADALLSSSNDILDIGQPDSPINDIYIWRSRSDGSRYSQYLISDYTPAVGERIVVEYSIPNPIALTATS